MVRSIYEVDRIEADIRGVNDGVKDIVQMGRALSRAGLELGNVVLPVMPDDVRSSVAAAMTHAGTAAASVLKVVDEELDNLRIRVERLIDAVSDDQTTNMDRAGKWLNRFIDDHEGFFDLTNATSPLGQLGLTDGSSMAKGFGGAALGTVDIVQLGFRSLGGDIVGIETDADRQLENIGVSIGRDPGAALRSAVQWDKITTIFSGDASAAQRRDAFSELLGGAGFDATIGLLTGGIGAGASRGSHSVSRVARGAPTRALEDLGVAEGKAVGARGRAWEAAARLEEIKAIELAEEPYGLSDRIRDFGRRQLGHQTRRDELNGIAERRRVAAGEAEEARLAADQLTANEVVFRDSVAKLQRRYTRQRRMDAAHNVNEVAGIVWLGIPTDARAALERLGVSTREAAAATRAERDGSRLPRPKNWKASR
jgi:hypothetical protein